MNQHFLNLKAQVEALTDKVEKFMPLNEPPEVVVQGPASEWLDKEKVEEWYTSLAKTVGILMSRVDALRDEVKALEAKPAPKTTTKKK